MNLISCLTAHPKYCAMVPASLTYPYRPSYIYALIFGAVLKESVEDFGLYTGKGLALKPATELVYVPCDGLVEITTMTNCAIGIDDRRGDRDPNIYGDRHGQDRR